MGVPWDRWGLCLLRPFFAAFKGLLLAAPPLSVCGVALMCCVLIRLCEPPFLLGTVSSHLFVPPGECHTGEFPARLLCTHCCVRVTALLWLAYDVQHFPAGSTILPVCVCWAHANWQRGRDLCVHPANCVVFECRLLSPAPPFRPLAVGSHGLFLWTDAVSTYNYWCCSCVPS